MKLILASGSPRRKNFLLELGIDFEVIPSNEEEIIDNLLSPSEIVKSLALQKARNVYNRTGEKAILSADSIVVFNGEILGKPKDEVDAKRMLRSLSGNVHEVMTGFAFIIGDKLYNECVISKVYFNDLSDEFIENYVATGSPLDKAGAYGIQDGGLASSYEGSYTNIIGLPMERITEIFKEEKLLK